MAAKEFLAVHSTGGVCEALALKWLKIKAKENSDDPQWKNFKRQKADPRVALIDREKTFDRAFARYAANTADQRYGIESYYGLRGLRQNLPVGITGVGITSWVARTVADSKHTYFLHSFRCPSFADGLHAVAYYTSSGKAFNVASHVYMFDPDYGEYKVPNAKFITWMPAFVNFFYGTGEGDTRFLQTMTLHTKRATP